MKFLNLFALCALIFCSCSEALGANRAQRLTYMEKDKLRWRLSHALESAYAHLTPSALRAAAPSPTVSAFTRLAGLKFPLQKDELLLAACYHMECTIPDNNENPISVEGLYKQLNNNRKAQEKSDFAEAKNHLLSPGFIDFARERRAQATAAKAAKLCLKEIRKTYRPSFNRALFIQSACAVAGDKALDAADKAAESTQDRQFWIQVANLCYKINNESERYGTRLYSPEETPIENTSVLDKARNSSLRWCAGFCFTSAGLWGLFAFLVYKEKAVRKSLHTLIGAQAAKDLEAAYKSIGAIAVKRLSVKEIARTKGMIKVKQKYTLDPATMQKAIALQSKLVMLKSSMILTGIGAGALAGSAFLDGKKALRLHHAHQELTNAYAKIEE